MMTATLNRLSADQLREMRHEYESRLARTSAFVGAPRPALYADEASACRALVAIRYALGDAPSELRALLSRCAQSYAKLFALRDLSRESEMRRRGDHVDASMYSPERAFAGVVSAITVFAPKVLLQFAALPREAYCNVFPPQFGIYHAAIAVLLDAALNTRDRLSEHLGEFRAAAADTGVHPTLVRRLVPVIDAVEALLTKHDAQGVDFALKALAEVHREDAQSGRGSTHWATLLCFDGLAIISMASRYGTQLRVDSPYLPIELIG